MAYIFNVTNIDKRTLGTGHKLASGTASTAERLTYRRINVAGLCFHQHVPD